MGFAKLRNRLGKTSQMSLAVAWGTDAAVLLACSRALEEGFVRNVAVTGPEDVIKAACRQAGIEPSLFTIVSAASPEEGAAKAVELVRVGQCNLLMKGMLNTAVLLRAVLNKERGIRGSSLLSHIAIVEMPDKRLDLLTDAAMNIRPDLEQKVAIVQNAIDFAWSIGLETPKVALLAAVETVNPKMPETVDAAAIAQMGARGQFRPGAIIDGPLAFDNAYSKEAAEHKRINSPVAGEVDIFVVPEITAGNILYKAFTYAAGFPTAGVVVGAQCPIVLTSRSDSEESKLNAILVAACAGKGSA